jgi:hypothetical protein
MFKFLWRFTFTLLVIGLLLCPLWGAFLLLEKVPRIASAISPSVESVGRAERLLREVDPRRLRQGQLKTIDLKESDFNVALGHALGRFAMTRQVRAEVDFAPRGAAVAATIELPANPIGSYLNIAFTLLPTPAGLDVSQVRLGRLAIPVWGVRKTLALAQEFAQTRAEYRDIEAALRAIHAVTLTDSTASVVFRWDEQLAARLGEHGRDLLLPAADRERLTAYRRHINAFIDASTTPSLPLIALLKPTFEFAASRTRGKSSVLLENRAALLALALTAIGRPQAWNHLLGDELANAVSPTKRRPRLTLQGRDDLPKHFLLSAALVGAADTAVADVIGVYKEVKDSHGGSGFSFVDLAADRAGVRFAEKAARSPRELQRAVVALTTESELLPSSADLSEGLQAADFERRFQNRDSAEYRKVAASIEARLDRLALYQ